MPRRIHQADSRERRPMAVAAAKGTPLSVRIASGRPNSRKRRWKADRVPTRLGGEACLAAEQVPAVGVGDGQRVAVAGVAGLELTLEVGCPELVGMLCLGDGTAGMSDTSASSRRSRLLLRAPPERRDSQKERDEGRVSMRPRTRRRRPADRWAAARRDARLVPRRLSLPPLRTSPQGSEPPSESARQSSPLEARAAWRSRRSRRRWSGWASQPTLARRE